MTAAGNFAAKMAVLLPYRTLPQSHQRHIHIIILAGEIIVHCGGQLFAGIDGKSHIQTFIQRGAGWFQFGNNGGIGRIFTVIE